MPTPVGIMNSSFQSSSPKTLEKAIAELGLSRIGDELFKGEQHVANVFSERYIFFLMGSGCYSKLATEAAKNEHLSVF
jgi:hypothetical protein